VSVLSRLLGRDDPEGVVVEPMRRRHLDGIMVIEQASYPRPWSHQVFENELEMARRGERNYLVARERLDVIGYGGLMFVLDDAHVTNLAVAATWRRRGVATRLLAELAWAARERGCIALTLEVRITNVGAQALYRDFGFVPAGVRQKYYESTEDAIVMWCNDLSLPEYADRLRELCPEATR